MQNNFIIKQTKKFIREKCENEGSGHDWWHIHRVWKNAIAIAKEEKADYLIIQLAALLHDVADFKFHEGDTSIGSKIAGEYLRSQNLNNDTIIVSMAVIKEQ